MENQKPSVGRIVHVGLQTSEAEYCAAAIILFVGDDESVNLKVWDKDGRENIMLNVPPDRWHWPERV